MRDPKGTYYYPDPGNKKERMYVRENEGSIEFRLWNQDYPEVWTRHGWLDLDIVKRAAAMYADKKKNPLKLYDLDVARSLLKFGKKS